MGAHAAETLQPVEVETGRRLASFEWLCVGVTLVAFLLRVPFVMSPRIIWDSAWYLMLARSFGETGTFWLPWSDAAAPMYSGYWPPLYPVFLSPLVATFGPSYHVLAAGSLLATLLLALVVLFTTWDLYDRARGFAAMAVVAASPAFIASNNAGMSEALLAAMVALAVWAYLKSLERPAWLAAAGAFALLAYLGKASLGLPFVLLGAAALVAFRVRMRGLRAVLRSPVDWGVVGLGLAGAAFFAFTRTEKFGGIGLGFIEPLKLVAGTPEWFPVFLFKVFFVAVFLLMVTLPLSLHVRDAWRDRRDERVGTLWLAVVLPLVLGAVFTATFYLTEGRELIDFDNIRYLTPGVVPFVWLMLPYVDFAGIKDLGRVKDRALHHRYTIAYVAAVGALMLVFLLNPMGPAQTLTRSKVFLGLALVPLALAGYVLTTHYDVASRATREVPEWRLVAARSPKSSTTFLLGVFAAGILLSWFISASFGYYAIAAAVAGTAMSPRTRVVAVALLFIAASAPGARTVFPVEDAAAEIDALLPADALVGVDDRGVYFSAVRPDDMRLTMVFPGQLDISPEVEALVLVNAVEDVPVNFTLVKRWHYDIELYPTTAIELRIEQALTGSSPTLCPITALSLYARDGTPLAEQARADPWVDPPAPEACPSA